MTDKLDWLDEADRATLEKMMTEKADDIITGAIEKAEQKFEGVNLEQQENLDLFNEYVKEYADTMLKAYTQRIEKLALEPFTKEEQRKRAVREYLPQIENFRFSNTKIENHLTKPETNLMELLEAAEGKRGFNADLASDDDKKEGKSYPVSAKFSLLNNTILPEDFNYSSSVRRLIGAIGTAYEYDGLETTVGGAKTIRADHLLNLLDGVDVTKRVTPERVRELVELIKYLSNIHIELDITKHQEYNALKPKNAEGADLKFKKGKRYGPLLSVIVDEYEDFSKDKHFYIEITRLPILYEYGKDAAQMITFERSLLNLTAYPEYSNIPQIDRIERMTPQIRAIADLMILETRGRGRNRDYTAITYERIYNYVDDDLGKKVRRQTLNSNIEKVAKYLVAKGQFKKYDIVRKGRKKYGTLHLYKS